MSIIEAMIKQVPAMRETDTAAEALRVMGETGLSRLPVVDGGKKYVGMVEAREAKKHVDAMLRDMELERQTPVGAWTSPVQIMNVLVETGTEIVAVTDKAGEVAGCVRRDDMLREMNHLMGGDERCGSVSVWMRASEYGMTELAGIIEGTGAKIVSMTTSRRGEEIEILVTTTAEDTSEICAALERHGIECRSYGDVEATGGGESELQRNYAELMMYLSV